MTTRASLPRQTIENGAWDHIRGIWQHLHGSFPNLGLSIEWHDFHLDSDLDWARSFHPGSLEICLNFSGNGLFIEGEARRAFGAGQLILYALRDNPLRAMRSADSLHRFLTLELSPAFLRDRFIDEMQMLKPEVRRFIDPGTKNSGFLELSSLPASLLPARMQFIDPPVSIAAKPTWYLGRVLEVLAQTLFSCRRDEELFCQRHNRINRERVERVCYWLERDLENPPSLEMLAKEAGCSTYYLSRVFARETGASIPKFLRMKRIEKAAALLRSGSMNVTEAAMTVGYSSLGAFTKAFVEQMGCCPGLYPFGKLPRPRNPR